jgi:hypothetical protein
MRINRCIQLGRLEIYVGRRPHWRPAWAAFRTAHGFDMRVGRWEFIGEWVPKRKPQAQVRAELLAKAEACIAARSWASWPARCSP